MRADITLWTAYVSFLPNEVLKAQDIEFSLNVDNIAQESIETFALTLQLSISTDQLGASASIRDRLEGVILDSDGKLNKECCSIVYNNSHFKLYFFLPSNSYYL